MKEYRMLETRKGEAEALMNRMPREGWEVVGVTYWSAWKLCLLITFSRKKLLLGLGMLLSGTVGFTGCLYGTDWRWLYGKPAGTADFPA